MSSACTQHQTCHFLLILHAWKINHICMQIFLACLNLVHNKWLKFHFQSHKGRDKCSIVRKNKGFAVFNLSPLKAEMSRQALAVDHWALFNTAMRLSRFNTSLPYIPSWGDISSTGKAKEKQKTKSGLFSNIYKFRISGCLLIKKKKNKLKRSLRQGLAATPAHGGVPQCSAKGIITSHPLQPAPGLRFSSATPA